MSQVAQDLQPQLNKELLEFLTKELDRRDSLLLALIEKKLQSHLQPDAIQTELDITPEYLPYHSTNEIKAIIMANMESIKKYFGDRVFAFSALVDHLQCYTELREGDLIINKSNTLRWNSQISNTIKSKAWKTCPIKNVKPGYYQIEIWRKAP